LCSLRTPLRIVVPLLKLFRPHRARRIKKSAHVSLVMKHLMACRAAINLFSHTAAAIVIVNPAVANTAHRPVCASPVSSAVAFMCFVHVQIISNSTRLSIPRNPYNDLISILIPPVLFVHLMHPTDVPVVLVNDTEEFFSVGSQNKAALQIEHRNSVGQK